jgi:hypothetical protein
MSLLLWTFYMVLVVAGLMARILWRYLGKALR